MQVSAAMQINILVQPMNDYGYVILLDYDCTFI